MKFSKLIYKSFILLLIVTRALCFFCFIKLIFLNKTIFIEWEIFNLNSTRIVISLVLDWVSLSFLGVVTLISRIIIAYSVYYIEGEKNQLRFSLILFGFILSIIFLIISPNLIRLLLGWDGLGLTSYALVVFYQNERSCNSGIITILSNRIGDSALLVSIGLCFYKSSWNFVIFDNIDTIIIMFIILAAITKRAQVPFSAWLPAAIAAPTPVSALVHSSTLVTAGVYLLIRWAPLIENNNVLFSCLIFGVLTTFIAGWVANFENDLKKVIALSTLSQLGVIFIIIGVGQLKLAYFHLVIHALFKSTLFICAGFIIHNLGGRQDSRFAGSLNKNRPVLGVVFSVTNLALCGFPFLAGFYSKDTILENTINTNLGFFLIFIIILATGLTVRYRLRVFYIRVLNNNKTISVGYRSDFSPLLILSTLVLFLLRIFGGFLFSWLMLSFGTIYDLKTLEKFFISLVILLSVFTIVNIIASKKNIFIRLLGRFSRILIFLPLLSAFLPASFFLKWGRLSSKELDKGWLEFYGPQGFKRPAKTLGKFFQEAQLVIFINQYLLIFLFIVILIIRLFCF